MPSFTKTNATQQNDVIKKNPKETHHPKTLDWLEMLGTRLTHSDDTIAQNLITAKTQNWSREITRQQGWTAAVTRTCAFPTSEITPHSAAIIHQ